MKRSNSKVMNSGHTPYSAKRARRSRSSAAQERCPGALVRVLGALLDTGRGRRFLPPARPLWLYPAVKIVTDGDHAPMASINNAICTKNYGHDGGISETGRDIGQLSRTELAGAELANVLVLIRGLGEVAPISFERD